MRADRFGLVLRATGALVLVVLLVAAFTPFPNLLARWTRPPLGVARSDAIVVLGAGIHPDGSLNARSFVRVVHGALLFRGGWAPVIVLSGGPREISARMRLALALGVPPHALVGDAASHTTRDEARRIGAILRARGVRTILLVTNTRHLVRARALFEREGLVVNAVPADVTPGSVVAPEQRLELFRSIVQEMVARAYYRLTGAL